MRNCSRERSDSPRAKGARAGCLHPKSCRCYDQKVTICVRFTLLGYLEGLGFLTTFGRPGEIRYMDIDPCLRRAFDLVDGRLAALVA